MRVKTALPALLFALSFFGAYAQTDDTMIVHFDLNQSLLRPDNRVALDDRFRHSKSLPDSFPTLRELLAIMKEHPGLRLEIDGFVCCMPETMDGWDIETKKQDLSVQRAKYVYDYLARFGIDTTRMSYRGFGAHGKIFPHEENSELMMRNRRVEIKILSWSSLIKE